MMKAVTILKDTSTSVADVPRPTAGRGEVLIRVEVSALDSAYEEVASRTLVPGSLLHSLRSRPLVAGWHFGGTVEGVGGGTAGLKAGDAGERNDVQVWRPLLLLSPRKSTLTRIIFFPSVSRTNEQFSDTFSTRGRPDRGASPSTSPCPRTSAPRSPTVSP